jgi:hypothetical protein
VNTSNHRIDLTISHSRIVEELGGGLEHTHEIHT